MHQTKFIPITIINIGIGSTLSGPIKIIYSLDSQKEYSTEVRLSGTNVQYDFPNTFAEIFSFENPKTKYPEISNEVWEIIQNKRVKIGMNETECKLSWGEPKTINTTIVSTSRHQQWVYSGSSYLYFEDGKLTSIQN